MPNNLAFLVLFAWPLVALVLFRTMPPLRALIWTILGGYLFLPVRAGIDFPMLPRLDKALIPSLTAAALFWAAQRRQDLQLRIEARRQQRRGAPVAAIDGPGDEARDLPRDRPGNRPGPPQRRRRTLVGLLSGLGLLMILVLPFAVYYTNREPLIFGTRSLPGIRPYDAFSMVLNNIVMILPFLLGRRYLGTPEAHREILRVLVWGGMIYTGLMLVEIRMSPQLNVWVYGFFAHEFGQHVRGGQYRPIVFLEHGLRVGIFMAMAVLAAATLWRLELRSWRLLGTGWLTALLYLSRNLGAFLIGLLLLPVAALGSLRARRLTAAVLAGMVLFYPMIRGAGLVPTDRLVGYATQISAPRGQSLQVRLDNEDRLLDKANQKPLFGWGGWGRSRVYDEDGRDISTTDGVWVIIMGGDGWFGYIAKFGLLTLPLLALLLRRRDPPDPAALGLSLILAANLVDMLPNSSLTPLSWLIAGALTGRLMQTQGVAIAAPGRAIQPPQRRPDRVSTRG